jgi:hypothetical protein
MSHTQSPCKWVKDASYPTIRRLERKAHHSPPPRAEVRMREAITPIPHTSSWPVAWYITQNLLYTVQYDHLLGCDTVRSFTLTMEVVESFETAFWKPSQPRSQQRPLKYQFGRRTGSLYNLHYKIIYSFRTPVFWDAKPRHLVTGTRLFERQCLHLQESDGP